jgi:hypothetical protein
MNVYSPAVVGVPQNTTSPMAYSCGGLAALCPLSAGRLPSGLSDQWLFLLGFFWFRHVSSDLSVPCSGFAACWLRGLPRLQ